MDPVLMRSTCLNSSTRSIRQSSTAWVWDWPSREKLRLHIVAASGRRYAIAAVRGSVWRYQRRRRALFEAREPVWWFRNSLHRCGELFEGISEPSHNLSSNPFPQGDSYDEQT